jgi:hypothetical protein
MKTPLIAPIAIVLLLLAACEQKSAQITSSSPPAPTPAPAEAVGTPDYSGVASSSVADASPPAEASNSPSTTGTANARPVFRNEDATQAANQYLDSYDTVLNDVAAVPGTRSSIPTNDPKAAIEAAMAQARKVGQDTQALASQQKQVNRLLTPDEKKRLREYQKSLEQGEQNTVADP